MPNIVPVVEGNGEMEALPLLLRKVLHEEMGRYDIGVDTPKNAHGSSNMQKIGELERLVRIASLEPDCCGVLVLMDADEACAVTLAMEFTHRIVACGISCSVATVIAKCEYEAWFLASIGQIAGKTLKGRPGLVLGTLFDGDVESVRGVKEWLTRHLPSSRAYRETTDQAAMTHWLDVTTAYERSRSFRRLYHAVEEIVSAVDSGSVVVTPAASA